jgi:small-conductance mechanosensitive channel
VAAPLLPQRFRRGCGARGVGAVALVLFLLVGGGAPALALEDGEADLTTPRRAAEHFVHATRGGNHAEAARVLDLRGIPAAEREARGPELARRLKHVLDRKLWLDLAQISDEPEGSPEDGLRTEHIGTIPIGERKVPVEMARVRLADGTRGWAFSQHTVGEIDKLYAAHGPHWIAERLPPVFSRMPVAEVHLWQWLGLLLAALVALLGGLGLGSLLVRLGRGVASRTTVEWDDLLMAQIRGPTRLFVGIVLLRVLVEPLSLAVPAQAGVHRLLIMLLVANIAWAAQRFVRFAADLIEQQALEHAAAGDGDDLSVRGVQTQVRLLRRVAGIVITVLALALMLVQFEVVRSVGMSLLASAGVAGIVIGFAAQRSISNLLVGVQLSITQPVRIGDTVIVEGEWGTIEEINLTYVVMRIWDERRLIVPMSNFLEKPFQNWTKVSKQLLGTVTVHADYRVPVQAVRDELDRILDGHPQWDGRAKGVVVLDATERTVQLRPLVSAKDASDLWGLRCDVREKVVAFLQQYEGGRYLPRARVEADEPKPSRTSARTAVSAEAT